MTKTEFASALRKLLKSGCKIAREDRGSLLLAAKISRTIIDDTHQGSVGFRFVIGKDDECEWSDRMGEDDYADGWYERADVSLLHHVAKLWAAGKLPNP
jgi:hypothetical protein